MSETERLLPAKVLLHGYDSMLRAISVISVDVEQHDAIMPIILKIQKLVRKYQRKDGEEQISGWVAESKNVDADILAIVSTLTIHPDSVGMEGLDLCALRRGVVDVYRSFSEPINMHLAKESIMSALREKGFEGELTFEKSEMGPGGDMLSVRLDTGGSEPDSPAKAPPKRRVH